MNRIIFLDIDGVLTSARIHTVFKDKGFWWRFDPVACEFFNKISGDDLDFVISSTWRGGFPEINGGTHNNPSEETFKEMLKNRRLYVNLHKDWRTSINFDKPDAIRIWLENHGINLSDQDKYLVIDDDEMHAHQVFTDSENGMTFQNYYQINHWLDTGRLPKKNAVVL